MRVLLASIVALLLIVGAIAGSYRLSLAAIDRSQHQWCDTLTLLTARPVPRPADPHANPSRMQAYVLYSDFVALRHRFGC